MSTKWRCVAAIFLYKSEALSSLGWGLQLFPMNKEFPVNASRKIALITSLFVHTARRYYWLNDLVRCSEWYTLAFWRRRCFRKNDQAWSVRGSKSHTKVFVGESAERSLLFCHTHDTFLKDISNKSTLVDSQKCKNSTYMLWNIVVFRYIESTAIHKNTDYYWLCFLKNPIEIQVENLSTRNMALYSLNSKKCSLIATLTFVVDWDLWNVAFGRSFRSGRKNSKSKKYKQIGSIWNENISKNS